MLAFLAVDGHLQVFAALAASFQSLPVSADLLHAPGWRTLASFGTTVFEMGLLLALPVIAALLIANLALGILNRAAPQIGVFQVGFPVTMLVGLLLVQLMIPNLVPFVAHLFDMGRCDGAGADRLALTRQYSSIATGFSRCPLAFRTCLIALDVREKYAGRPIQRNGPRRGSIIQHALYGYRSGTRMA